MPRINAVSLDAVAVAAVWLAAVTRLHTGHGPDWGHVCLMALTVWLVYTGDHLMDARKERSPACPIPYRHVFHRQHWRLISITMMAAAPLLMVAIPFVLNSVELALAALGSVAVGGYLILVHRRNRLTVDSLPVWFKPAVVASLFAYGMHIPALAAFITGELPTGNSEPFSVIRLAATWVISSGLFFLNCQWVSNLDRQPEKQFRRLPEKTVTITAITILLASSLLRFPITMVMATGPALMLLIGIAARRHRGHEFTTSLWASAFDVSLVLTGLLLWATACQTI
ncbi:hypothetical protein [Stieleria varia]|uniref:hypothetical protein n=1 Tax=Stieleria varia TaxID=2528005 RepID=UPI0011B51829|nr:hypothetical protein [Stieleria varia]